MVARRGLLRKYYSVSVMTKLRAQIKDIRARITVHHLLSSSPPPQFPRSLLSVIRTEPPPLPDLHRGLLPQTLTSSPPPYQYIAAWSHPNQPHHPAPGPHPDSYFGLLEGCALVDAKVLLCVLHVLPDHRFDAVQLTLTPPPACPQAHIVACLIPSPRIMPRCCSACFRIISLMLP